MLAPINNNQKSCISIVNDYTHVRTKPIDNTISILKNTFEVNPSFNNVFRNFDHNQSFKTWIYEGNEKDKIVGYKYIQSYPYDDVKFEIGDYIEWKYGNSDLSTWLIISLDKQYTHDVKGRMLLCNNTLKWINSDNETISYPCVIEDSMSYTNFKFGNSGVVEPGADIVVLVQKNADTMNISVNDRYMFNNRAFRVKQNFNELNPNYLEIYMSKVAELQNDNFIDNIAKNDNIETIIIDDNTVVEPNIIEILEGNTVSFSVFKYINKVKQSDAFTVTGSNIPNSNYTLTTIDNNNFSIKNELQYRDNPLTISILNNSTNEVITKEYWMGGKW